MEFTRLYHNTRNLKITAHVALILVKFIPSRDILSASGKLHALKYYLVRPTQLRSL